MFLKHFYALLVSSCFHQVVSLKTPSNIYANTTGIFYKVSNKIKINFTKKTQRFPCLILSFLCYLLSVQRNIWQEAMATRRKFGTLSRNCPRSKIWRPHGHQKSVGKYSRNVSLFIFPLMWVWPGCNVVDLVPSFPLALTIVSVLSHKVPRNIKRMQQHFPQKLYPYSIR